MIHPNTPLGVSEDVSRKEVDAHLVEAHVFGPDTAVCVYFVRPEGIEPFYLVTLRYRSNEVAWGMDYTAKKALTRASQEWAIYAEEGEENPFAEVLRLEEV